MTDDSSHIDRCLELARQSLVDGDLPFGAVIVAKGKVLAEAHNTGRKDITGHAEVNAIKQALADGNAKSPQSWTLYSNVEPCAMCAFLIRDIGIGRVVFGSSSPHWGGLSRWNILTDTTLRPEFTSNQNAVIPEVVAHVNKESCDALFSELGWKMHLPSSKDVN